MDVTELGIVIEVRPLQPLKVQFPIDVTELGMVMEVRPLQPEKALSSMDVTDKLFPLKLIFSGITTMPVYLFGFDLTSATLFSRIML